MASTLPSPYAYRALFESTLRNYCRPDFVGSVPMTVTDTYLVLLRHMGETATAHLKAGRKAAAEIAETTYQHWAAIRPKVEKVCGTPVDDICPHYLNGLYVASGTKRLPVIGGKAVDMDRLPPLNPKQRRFADAFCAAVDGNADADELKAAAAALRAPSPFPAEINDPAEPS